MARPTGLTPDVHQRVVNAVRAGCYAHEVAGYAGIGESTLYRWLARGRLASDAYWAAYEEAMDLPGFDPDTVVIADPDFIYRELWDSVASARSEARVEAQLIIRSAIRGEPQRDSTGTAVPGEWVVRPDPRLALEWLSRIDPEHYGRTRRDEPETTAEEDPEELRRQVLALIDDAETALADG